MIRRIRSAIVSLALVVAHAPTFAADWRNQVIYLVIPDRFFNGDTSNDRAGSPNCFDPAAPRKFQGGDFKGLASKLPYLKDLGVTAIWTTPAYKQVAQLADGSCGYHGYWADFTDPDEQAVEPALGTRRDLRRLVRSAQRSGMRFVFDMVANHAGYDARITKSRPDWFHKDPECRNAGPPDIFCPLFGLPDFASEKPEVAIYLAGITKGWATQYPIDGIRMDTARHMPVDYWRTSWIPQIRAARPGIFLLGEVFLEDSANSLKPFLDAGFDSLFNFPLRQALVQSFGKGATVDRIANRMQEDLSILGLDRMLDLTTLLDNHDTPRFVNEPGVAVSEDEIRRRYHMALAALFTLPGIPQLYYGNELGMYGGGDPDNRRMMPSWAWDAAGRTGTHTGQAPPDSQRTFELTRQLIALRKAERALSHGYYAEMWRHNGDPSPNVYAYLRASGDSRLIIMFNNGALESGMIRIAIAANTGIQESDRNALAGRTLRLAAGEGPAEIRVDSGFIPVNLPAKSFAIYR